MAEITAAAVKELRDKTGIAMMDCKKALTAADGDPEKAVEWLRTNAKKKFEVRADRETAFGRMGVYTEMDPGCGAMVEVKCESAPVAGSDDFINFANDLARVLAHNAKVTTVEDLLQQPALYSEGQTLGEWKDDLFNRIREVFNIARIVRFDGPCGAYTHNAGTVSGALLEVTGNNAEAARDICMHISAMKPAALKVDELDPKLVAKEREVLAEAARQSGKPDNIIDKIVEGQLKKFYSEKVAEEQPFVKDDSMTVGEYAKKNGLELVRFEHWILGEK